MKRGAVLLLSACSQAQPPVVANQGHAPGTWAERVVELCAPLGGDDAPGLAAIVLPGVTVGEEAEGFGTSGGWAGMSWKVVSPKSWSRVGLIHGADQLATLDGSRKFGKSHIMGVWISVDTPPAALCAALGYPLGGPHGVICQSLHLEVRRAVQIGTREDGSTELACYETKPLK